MDKTFYVTTPIYYVNDVPHLGHAYTTIIADAIARFKKLMGYEVFFLTGTDEHGQKVEKAARSQGMEPKELADKVVERFKNLWKKLNIKYDYFIRTTEKNHEEGVKKIFSFLMRKGDIYKGVYSGWYCVSDESFLPESAEFSRDGKKICPDCGRESEIVSEECYFFRLSKYRDKLLKLYEENSEFIQPLSRKNEVISFVKAGLKDLSITRATVRWGIPVPEDSSQTIYVWFDALTNYLTGVGYGWDENKFNKFWPADVHLIGKDILRFHAIYWPAFLISAEIPLPKRVFGHGWWLKDETKMSKTKGNVLDPYILLNTFGSDSIRYFLLREIPIGLDGNFSHEGFINRINSDLANDLGNLLNRMLVMTKKYFKSVIDIIDQENDIDTSLRKGLMRTKKSVIEEFEKYSISRGLEVIWDFIYEINKYLDQTRPWSLSEKDKKRGRLGRILFQGLESIRLLTPFLFPVMPESAEKIWNVFYPEMNIENLNLNEIEWKERKSLKVREPFQLFPRINSKEFFSG